MTAHTEPERAAFEAVASDNGKWPQAVERDAKGNYLLLTTANGWMWWQQAWQAARRAPAVPMPQWGKVGTCEWFDGYADHSDGGGPYKERVLYAAAPQPPEAKESIEHLARLDMNYALGMREGWNRCVEGDEAGYAKRREHLISEARKVLKDAPEAERKTPELQPSREAMHKAMCTADASLGALAERWAEPVSIIDLVHKIRLSAYRDGELGRHSTRTSDIEQQVRQILSTLQN